MFFLTPPSGGQRHKPFPSLRPPLYPPTGGVCGQVDKGLPKDSQSDIQGLRASQCLFTLGWLECSIRHNPYGWGGGGVRGVKGISDPSPLYSFDRAFRICKNLGVRAWLARKDENKRQPRPSSTVRDIYCCPEFFWEIGGGFGMFWDVKGCFGTFMDL